MPHFDDGGEEKEAAKTRLHCPAFAFIVQCSNARLTSALTLSFTIMELFMHNLPPDLTDQGLNEHLTPFVKALNIRDWSCQKQRKKRLGSITFLRSKDGEQFQRQHGQQPVPGANYSGQARFTARLIILGTPVYCMHSKNDPDPFLLKSLAKLAEDRQEAEQ